MSGVCIYHKSIINAIHHQYFNNKNCTILRDWLLGFRMQIHTALVSANSGPKCACALLQFCLRLGGGSATWVCTNVYSGISCRMIRGENDEKQYSSRDSLCVGNDHHTPTALLSFHWLFLHREDGRKCSRSKSLERRLVAEAEKRRTRCRNRLNGAP